jgi:hypothetical protein
MQHRTSK